MSEIGVQAFQGCSSLTSVYIPEGVAVIGSLSFAQCTSLISIKLPDSVKIGKNTFYGTPLEYKNK